MCWRQGHVLPCPTLVDVGVSSLAACIWRQFPIFLLPGKKKLYKTVVEPCFSFLIPPFFTDPFKKAFSSVSIVLLSRGSHLTLSVLPPWGPSDSPCTTIPLSFPALGLCACCSRCSRAMGRDGCVVGVSPTEVSFRSSGAFGVCPFPRSDSEWVCSHFRSHSTGCCQGLSGWPVEVPGFSSGMAGLEPGLLAALGVVTACRVTPQLIGIHVYVGAEAALVSRTRCVKCWWCQSPEQVE